MRTGAEDSIERDRKDKTVVSQDEGERTIDTQNQQA